MGNIGDSMSAFTIPIVGTTGTTYATNIDAFLTEVAARLGVKMPLSSLQPGTLDFANNPAINLQYLMLLGQAGAPTSPSGSLQNFGGNLYWVSPAGAVQITTGNAINLTSLFGITGDYGGSNPAQLRFVNANNEYYFYQDFANNKWSAAFAQFFDLSSTATGANPPYVRLSSAGTGSTYTLTMPTAVPGTQSLVQMTAAGALLATNTLANSPTAPDWKYTSAQTYTIPALNATGGASAGASPVAALTSAVAGGIPIAWTFSGGTFGTTLFSVHYPLQNRVGDIVTGYTTYFNKLSPTHTTIKTFLLVYDSTNGNQAFASTGVSNSAAAPGFTTLTESGLSFTIAANHQAWVKVDFPVSGGTLGCDPAFPDQIYSTAITYTR